MYTRLYTYGRVMVIGTIFISLARQILRIQKKMWKMAWNEYVVNQCVVFRTHVEDLNFEILSIQLQLFYFFYYWAWFQEIQTINQPHLLRH